MKFLKKYLLLFLKGKDDLHFKVSVILIAMAPRLFRCMYSLVKAIV